MSRKRKKRKPIPHGRIEVVDGQPIVDRETARILRRHKLGDTPLFLGESMTCTICRAQQRSDPRVSSQWRCIVADGQPYYFCPAEFPPDGASGDLFQVAYDRCLLAVMKRRAGEELTEEAFRPVDWTG